MATHSSILAWRIPWMEEPGGLQSIETQSNMTEHIHTHTHTQPSPVKFDQRWITGFLPRCSPNFSIQLNLSSLFFLYSDCRDILTTKS